MHQTERNTLLKSQAGVNPLKMGKAQPYTCTLTPSVSGVTPQWTFTPLGGGSGGLTPCVFSPNGTTASVTFFWHDGDGEVRSCSYELKCQTSADCVATKNITLTLPEDWGDVQPDFDFDFYGTPISTNSYRIEGCTTTTSATDVNCDDYLLPNSQFMTKALAHENQHYNDFHEGDGTPASSEGNRLGTKYLSDNNKLYKTLTLEDIEELWSLVDIYITDELIGEEGNSSSWAEKRAYAADKLVPPHYFER
jgi:hypothetical protein